MGQKYFGTFYRKELQKTNQTEFRIQKVIMNYILSGKVVIICLIAGLIKKNHYIKSVVVQNQIGLVETK